MGALEYFYLFSLSYSFPSSGMAIVRFHCKSLSHRRKGIKGGVIHPVRHVSGGRFCDHAERENQRYAEFHPTRNSGQRSPEHILFEWRWVVGSVAVTFDQHK